jgi:hypothetical protein
MKFSKIDFIENQIDAPVCGMDCKSIGFIQLIIKKVCGVKPGVDKCLASAADTSAIKVWEQDKKIAGKVSISTRLVSRVNL